MARPYPRSYVRPGDCKACAGAGVNACGVHVAPTRRPREHAVNHAPECGPAASFWLTVGCIVCGGDGSRATQEAFERGTAAGRLL